MLPERRILGPVQVALCFTLTSATGGKVISIFSSLHKTKFQYTQPYPNDGEEPDRELDLVAAALQAALAREQALRLERSELLRRQDCLMQEFEHRLGNSLQLVAGMLTLQGCTAATAEAAAQLSAASRRVNAIKTVHSRLHAFDRQERVEFRNYLEGLCGDLSGLLFHDPSSRAIIVQSAELEMPTTLGVPLGFIVAELITNACKHTKGDIAVRLEPAPLESHSLSVLDDGPGLPADFDPASSAGLGMKIILLLVKQIGGDLNVFPGDGGRGARFTITFRTTES
jgi:two-component sensor histidine kinase